jgi:hypothetical protein
VSAPTDRPGSITTLSERLTSSDEARGCLESLRVALEKQLAEARRAFTALVDEGAAQMATLKADLERVTRERDIALAAYPNADFMAQCQLEHEQIDALRAERDQAREEAGRLRKALEELMEWNAPEISEHADDCLASVHNGTGEPCDMGCPGPKATLLLAALTPSPGAGAAGPDVEGPCENPLCGRFQQNHSGHCDLTAAPPESQPSTKEE